jgi:hypothetical protein
VNGERWLVVRHTRGERRLIEMPRVVAACTSQEAAEAAMRLLGEPRDFGLVRQFHER